MIHDVGALPSATFGGWAASMRAASVLIPICIMLNRARGLRRIHGGGNLHFITTSCYQREPLLGSARARDVFLEIFEQVRRRYDFDVIGYVVMPEHTGSPASAVVAVAGVVAFTY